MNAETKEARVSILRRKVMPIERSQYNTLYGDGRVDSETHFKIEGSFVDRKTAIAIKYAEIMQLLDIQPTDDNEDTPFRVAKSLMEMTANHNRTEEELLAECTVFDNNSYGVRLEMQDIEFSSLCSHHHLPFFGKVSIEYIPGTKIIGLSKFARIVEFFAQRPQVQEDFTKEIAQFLQDVLAPDFVEVKVYDTTHTCMCSRGVRSKAGTNTTFTIGNRK